jgi:hypothetical protein
MLPNCTSCLPACLPAFHFWKDAAFGHRPVRLIFEILPSAWGYKHVTPLATVRRALAVVARSFVFGTLSSGKTMQSFYWV